MAYDEGLAQHIRDSLGGRVHFTEKKMFGGLAFMVRGNMCLGVLGKSIMARVGPEQYCEMLARKHVREMDFTGKPMVGYVFVDADGLSDDAELAYIVENCLRFNGGLPAK